MSRFKSIATAVAFLLSLALPAYSGMFFSLRRLFPLSLFLSIFVLFCNGTERRALNFIPPPLFSFSGAHRY